MKKLNLMADYLYNKSIRDYMIFEIGINLGVRVTDFTHQTVAFYRQVCEKGYLEMIPSKTARYNKKIRIPVQEDLRKLIAKYIEGRSDNEPMFVSRDKGGMLGRQQINRIVKDAAKHVGIKENVGCHSMRKTFGYWHYKNNKDIRILMEIFNHSNEEVTLRYIGVTAEEIESSMQCMNMGVRSLD
ncbi:MAG: tyrosine-type recombinase/integrase [Lachnospiraceae bacterium]|nr:tyrosine-type recombinase/integrase [Lachnospiraceae bacterium]